MASYRSFGGLDDQPLIDGDVGFIGMNQRERPSQLKAGEVVLSKNGRIDGFWQPRKGIDLKSGQLANSSLPLTLPFIVIDSPITISTGSRASDVATINLAAPHGIDSGDLPAYITLGTPSVATEPITGIPAGSYLMSYVDTDSLSFASEGTDGSLTIDGTYGTIATRLDDTAISNIYGSCLFSNPASNLDESIILATNTEAKNIKLSDYSSTSIPYPNGQVVRSDIEMIQAFDRVYLFREGLQPLEWHPNGRNIVSASQSGSTTVDMSVTNHGLAVGDEITVTGLTGGTPANGTFTVASVTSVDDFTFDNDQIIVSGTLSPDIAGVYEKGEGTINGRDYWKSNDLVRTGPAIISGMNPAFSGAGTLIYFDGFSTRWFVKYRTTTAPSTSFSSSWFSGASAPVSIFAATGWTPSAPATGTPAFAAVSQTQTFDVSNGLISTGFTVVPGGVYTQPQSFNVAANVYGVASGLVRITVAGNTTIKAGDSIRITSTDVTELSTIVGNTYTVTDATGTEIYFNAPIGDVTYGSGSASEYIEITGRFSQGLGFIRMPAPEWAVYFQRRLWTPYFYTPAGTGLAPTYTDKKVRDEICASDILDANTYDSVTSQFRVTAGIADYLVGMHPFYDDQMIVFNRNSIHMITGTQGTLSDTVLREMTREVGCLARKSIASKGNLVMFLSDDGVYALEFMDEYNLRGTEEPLSKAIQPFIDRINAGLAADSVGIYFNNRYYLAVPLDSEVGANDATGNNSILVYNIKNKAWESVDTFGNNDFNITEFLRGQAEERNELYIVNSTGGIHLAEANSFAQDNYSASVTGDELQAGIDYELKTRGYTFNDYGRKKYKKSTIQMQSGQDNASDVDFYFDTEDPDSGNNYITDIATMLDPAIGLPGQLLPSENADFSFRLGNPRGVYGVLTIKRKIVGSTAIGRPKVTSVAIEATKASRQTITQS